jgi:quercetin dioxygenase-like cupin family protein
MIHEDERRILEDWPEAKIITAKTDCFLGDHYHKIKTEKFILILGTVNMTIDGESQNMTRGFLYTIYPNQKHSFALTEGSVLIGLCSHPYDQTDDYK